jgi:tetratricopeptide (TPR) repeat protein
MEGSPPSRLTLPPPEWTAPATAVVEIVSFGPPPLARRKGGRAEEATMRAQVSDASAREDTEAYVTWARQLARWLASRDRDLDDAIRLAENALEIADDPELRRELAAWLESLGEPGRAAEVLRAIVEQDGGAALVDLDPTESSYLLVRVGVLLARAGLALEASVAFQEGMRLDRSDALGGELRGALSSWAPSVVSPAEGAEAYVEAAKRRAASGATDAELEDLLRAFATDATHAGAAESLATALAQRGKGAAADELWRAHGSARGAPEVHARLRREALETGDLPRALGAALDEGLDGELDGVGADTLNALLLRMGLSDLLAARLEARARGAGEISEPSGAPNAQRARRYEELARLYAGPLADPDRAAGAHVAALAADPACEEAILALRAALGDSARKLDLRGGDARLDPMQRLSDTLRAMPDESERHRHVVEQLTRCTGYDPRWAAAVARATARSRSAEEANDASRVALDRAPTSRIAASCAWVDARGAGDMHAQARAIEHLGKQASPAVKAVLLSVAAVRYAGALDRESARRAAEQACQADSSSPRAIATLADAVAGDTDRAAGAALERAIHQLGARSSWCASLAAALEAMGERAFAVAWTQRLVALRPGDLEAIESLVTRIMRAGDTPKLGDALSWVLSQPQPLESIAELFATALRELGERDLDRAVVIARRALEVYGPKHATLRAALMEVAGRANDDAFAAAVLERWLSSGATDGDRVALFEALATRRHSMGDRDGEARVMARAMREERRFPELQKRAAFLLGEGVSADGELALMEARAEMLAAGSDMRAAASAWRDYGGACWDLAGDREAAVFAWARAAKVAPVKGYGTLGVDLAEFGGAGYALDVLSKLASREDEEPKVAGAFAAEAARAALSIGDFTRALDLAALALARNPSYADALEIAERAAVRADRESELSGLYDAVATRALGRFGRRAAHYRGARFFEQRGDGALALKHAAQAFVAVPTEGATFVLLARTAERAGDRAHAVRMVEQVAEAARSRTTRAGWLLRAASLAGQGEDGARRRVELLLRAAVLAPDLGTLALLSDAARELLRLLPEERDVVEMRLSRASKTLTDKLDGPEGTRIALSFAKMSLELWGDAGGALDMIERALAMDADLDDYAPLAERARELAGATDAAGMLARVIASAEKPYANVGIAALSLFAKMADALGDLATRGKAIVLAAERDPESDALVLAADAVVRELGDEALAARLAKKVPPARRGEALRTLARERLMESAFVDAAAALERAVELVLPEERAEVERELHQAYEGAGRGTDIEQRVQREAQAEETTPAVRAARWTEIADRREQRRDVLGAVRALAEAAKIDPAPIERWSALERVSELAGDDEMRVTALREIASRVTKDGRIAVWKRLARALDSRGDADGAERAYADVLALDPDDEDADHAMETLIVAAGRYEHLVDHLARRSDRLTTRGGQREGLRALRLRRAAILEQRLGRIQDACDELQRLLAEWPDNASTLRYLADLYDRIGDPARSAPLWRRATALETDRNVQDELEMRAARASHAAGDVKTALRHARAVLVRNPTSSDALELHIELARATGEYRELGDALEALAVAALDAVSRSDMLLEAAQAAGRCGDQTLALSRAQRAAQITPDRAAPQLFARGLEYRQRGPGDPAEARRTIEELGKIRDTMVLEDSALRAFLLAEALDVVQGGGAGMRELSKVHAELGDNALLAAGMAERLTKQGNHAAALPYFDMAITGSLFGLRRTSAVALAAAESAVRCMQIDAAERLLEVAAGEPETRFTALARSAQLAITQGWTDKARARLLDVAALAEGEDHARLLLQLMRLLLSSTDAEHFDDVEAVAREVAAAVTQSQLARMLTNEIESARAGRQPMRETAPDSAPMSRLSELQVPSLARPTASTSRPRLEIVTSDAPPATSDVTVSEGGSLDTMALEAAVRNAKTPFTRCDARVALGRAHAQSGARAAAEMVFWEALSEGSIDAGDELCSLLASARDRTRDVVRIRRQQVELEPGDIARLEMLRNAAIADDDRIYARAVEHVARALDPGAGPLPPPPLSAQTEQPGMLTLLAKPSQVPVGEALALLWEGAHSAFVRDPKSYAITGVARVVPGSTSALSRLYEVAIRVLDTPRIPLFLTRASGALSASVAVIQPPSVILTGDTRDDSPELRFVLGRGMAAALHNNVLTLGLPDRDARLVFTAMLGAFGPPERGSALDQDSGRLAEQFWQLIPQRTQRRLQELLGAGPFPDYEAMLERGHQCGRRVGLFLAGDFGTAARALLAERGVDLRAAQASGGLRRACAEIPPLADLLRLAVSPEYADARWHPVAPSSTRGTMSSSRFRIV